MKCRIAIGMRRIGSQRKAPEYRKMRLLLKLMSSGVPYSRERALSSNRISIRRSCFFGVAIAKRSGSYCQDTLVSDAAAVSAVPQYHGACCFYVCALNRPQAPSAQVDTLPASIGSVGSSPANVQNLRCKLSCRKLLSLVVHTVIPACPLSSVSNVVILIRSRSSKARPPVLYLFCGCPVIFSFYQKIQNNQVKGLEPRLQRGLCPYLFIRRFFYVSNQPTANH